MRYFAIVDAKGNFEFLTNNQGYSSTCYEETKAELIDILDEYASDKVKPNLKVVTFEVEVVTPALEAIYKLTK